MCDPTGIRGDGPLSQAQFPPQGDVRPENPGLGPLRFTLSLLRGTRPGTVPCPLPGRRARRPCPGPQACSLGPATLGTARACWAFLLGLGPSAETLVPLRDLSPPRPLGEARQGLLRSTLRPPLRPAFCPRAQVGSQEGWGYPTRFSLPGWGSGRPASSPSPRGPSPGRPSSPQEARRKTPCWETGFCLPSPPPTSLDWPKPHPSLPPNPSRPPPLGWLSPKSASGGETEAREGVLGLQQWPGSS